MQLEEYFEEELRVLHLNLKFTSHRKRHGVQCNNQLDFFLTWKKSDFEKIEPQLFTLCRVEYQDPRTGPGKVTLMKNITDFMKSSWWVDQKTARNAVELDMRIL